MRVLLGLVCDREVAPATVVLVTQAVAELLRVGHEATLRIERSAGQPDVSRSRLATAAVAGRFEVLVLVDSGAWCGPGGVSALCAMVQGRFVIAGAPLEPLNRAASLLSSSLTAYSVEWLRGVQADLPTVDQGFAPFFIAEIAKVERRTRYIPGAWALSAKAKSGTVAILADLPCGWGEPPAGEPSTSMVEAINYPEPRLPVWEYLHAMEALQRPRGVSLVAPPPPIPRPASPVPGKIKVALVNTCMLAGGAERQFCTIACGLDRARFEPVVVNAGPDMGAHAPLLEMLERAEIPCVTGPDAAEIDSADVTMWWGPAFARRTRGPVPGGIFVAQGDDPWTLSALMSRRTWVRAAVGVSGSAAAMLAEALPPGVVARTIWNGIGSDEFYRLPRRPWDPDRELVLGYLGRLSAEKNVLAIIAALTRLPTRVRLRVWGGGVLEGFMRSAAQELELGDRVEFAGVVADCRDALSRMDALVLASIHEGQPLTVLEAMHARVPVVAPILGDLPLILGEGRGVLIEPTTAGVTSGVEFLLRMSCAERLEDQVNRAQAFALAHLELDGTVANYSALIEEVACLS